MACAFGSDSGAQAVLNRSKRHAERFALSRRAVPHNKGNHLCCPSCSRMRRRSACAFSRERFVAAACGLSMDARARVEDSATIQQP